MNGLSLILCFMVAALLVWVTNWLALAPWRKARGAHWTERARLLHPVRLAARGNLFTVPLVVMLGHRLVWPESDLPWSGSLLAAWLGALAGTYPLDREVFPWIRFGYWLREAAVYRVLGVAHILILACLFLLMPESINGQAWFIFLLGVAFQAWHVWGGLLRGLRLMHLIKPAPEEVQRLATEVAKRMGMQPPTVWILRSSSANAFASPYTYTLLLTERGLAQLSEEELSAVMVHELGHLRETLTVRWVRFFGSLVFVPWLFLKPLYCMGAWVSVFFVAIIPLFLFQALVRVNRRLEESADELALHHEDARGVYAQALERIYQDNQTPAVMPSSRQLHPHLYDRMQKAGFNPDYPRPKPPATISWHGSMFCVLLVVLTAILFDIQALFNPGDSSRLAVEAETVEPASGSPMIQTNSRPEKSVEPAGEPPQP